MPLEISENSSASVGPSNWQSKIYSGSENDGDLHFFTEPCSDEILKNLEVDLIIAGIGVTETVPKPFEKLEPDMNMRVDDNIYAAGDCCNVNWPESERPFWFQMKLWQQAHQMGAWAAVCMEKDQPFLDFTFNTFAHMTNHFGWKITYLGLYTETNGVQFSYRVTKGLEYIKLVIRNNELDKQSYIIGAVLIGETDLEEVVENLIQNQLNIYSLKDDILNPDIDLDHYFD